tara:strand:- start:108 stop:797 length:690 start_codon:yes stop_codon:yes gene_type:complete
MNLLREYIRGLLTETVEQISQIQPDSIIYCDMDGVLVDFQTNTIELVDTLLSGESVPGIYGDKRFFQLLDKIKLELGKDFIVSSGADLNLKPVRKFMFYVISMNPGGFYASLPPLPDGAEQLWPYLAESGHRLNILSAPVSGKKGAPMTAAEGKKRWVEENLSPAPEEVIIMPAAGKPEYATLQGIPNILIDDKASTVRTWNDRGGVGVLHIPGDSNTTISRLRELGLK